MCLRCQFIIMNQKRGGVSMTTQKTKTFESLLVYFQKEKVVERIYKSADPVETFNKIENSLEKSFEQLRKEIRHPIKNRRISSDEVLEVCTMCLMSGMDDYELLDDYWQLVLALQEVKGDKKQIANKFYDFLLASGIFSDENQGEELITRFFK